MLRAVLIDDDQSNLSSLSEKLAKHCPQVEIIGRCDTAQDGIAVIEKEMPGLVFLDIEMPVMNGFVLLQQLKYRSFGLVFVTAYDHRRNLKITLQQNIFSIEVIVELIITTEPLQLQI